MWSCETKTYFVDVLVSKLHTHSTTYIIPLLSLVIHFLDHIGRTYTISSYIVYASVVLLNALTSGTYRICACEHRQFNIHMQRIAYSTHHKPHSTHHKPHVIRSQHSCEAVIKCLFKLLDVRILSKFTEQNVRLVKKIDLFKTKIIKKKNKSKVS